MDNQLELKSSSTTPEMGALAIEFSKTVGLFMRGKKGIAVALAAYATGEVFSGKSKNNGELAEDVARGLFKGLAMKSSLHGLGQLKLGPASQGILLGVSNRFSESALSRSTYKEPDAWESIKRRTFDSVTIKTDIAVFLAAHGALKGLDATTGLVSRRPLIATSLTGGTFGFAGGTSSELLRQKDEAEAFDLGKAMQSGLCRAALDGLAAIPGGLQADAHMSAELLRFGRRARHRVEQEARWVYLRDFAKVEPQKMCLIIPESIRQSSDWQAGMEAITKLRTAGYDAFFVGGCVRDLLNGKVPKDYDVVTNASPKKIVKIFPDGKFAGKAFGVMHAHINGHEVEIATFRADGSYSDGRRPDYVTLITRMPPRVAMYEDSSRRDFTINAAYMDPVTSEVSYYFDTPADLIKKRIDTVGDPKERFTEDRTRMLRAARFVSRFGFDLAPRVERTMAEDPKSIHFVVKEMWGSEFSKLLTGEHVLKGLDVLKRTGILREMMPEVEKLDTALGDQDSRHHPEGNTWVHTRMVLEELSKVPNRTTALMFSGLLHDIGKPATQLRLPDGRITNHQHDKAGEPIAKEICKRLRLSKDDTQEITDNVLNHMSMHNGRNMKNSTLLAYLSKPNIVNLIELQNADALGRGQCCAPSENVNSEQYGTLRDFWYEKLNQLKETAVSVDVEPILTGDKLKALGFKQGKALGAVKDAARLAQFEGRFHDEASAIQWLNDAGHLPVARQPKKDSQ